MASQTRSRRSQDEAAPTRATRRALLDRLAGADLPRKADDAIRQEENDS